jgi:hypothetical protein
MSATGRLRLTGATEFACALLDARLPVFAEDCDLAILNGWGLDPETGCHSVVNVGVELPGGGCLPHPDTHPEHLE